MTTEAVANATQVPEAWQSFNLGKWNEEIDVRDFIQRNYTPYLGGEEFLAGPTEKTTSLM